MRIFIFGDSIAHGLWDPSGGWVQRIRTQYVKQALQHLEDNNKRAEIYNLSIDGETAEGVAKRLNLEVKNRQISDNPVIIIAIGINDTMIYKGVEANSTELFKGELQQITASARQFTDRLLFVGMNAVDEKVCCPWKYAPEDIRFMNDRIWNFEKVLREYCQENNLPVVEIFEAIQGKRIEENLLADGLHPNDKGHELIAKLVKQRLDEVIDTAGD